MCWKYSFVCNILDLFYFILISYLLANLYYCNCYYYMQILSSRGCLYFEGPVAGAVDLDIQVGRDMTDSCRKELMVFNKGRGDDTTLCFIATNSQSMQYLIQFKQIFRHLDVNSWRVGWRHVVHSEAGDYMWQGAVWKALLEQDETSQWHKHPRRDSDGLEECSPSGSLFWND